MSPATPQPPLAPPSETTLDAHAELIRLEDRREFDPVVLERLAASGTAAIRGRAALALARLRRAEGAPLLLHLLHDPDTAVSAAAAFALGQLGDSLHAPALATVLSQASDSMPTVSAEAAYALGKLGGAAARDALVSTLRQSPPDSGRTGGVASALLAIWRLPRLDDLEPVTRWLNAPDPELRWRAAYALTRRPEPRSLQLLRAALGDSDPRVRAQAVRGLTAAAADSAGESRASVARDVVSLLDDADYEVAINAARALGTHGGAEVVRALTVALESPRRHLVIAALEALGRIGESAIDAAPALAAAAGADSLPASMRVAAAEALARVDPSVAKEVARRLQASPSWRLRAAAARVHAIADGGVSPELRAMFDDRDARVVSAALQAALDEVGADLGSLRPVLIEQLGADDVMVRAAALTALARMPAPEFLPMLLDAYGRARSDTLNDAALAALDAIGAISAETPVATRTFLARFRRSDDPLVRLRALQRLDSAAVIAAWGEPLPLETGRPAADYRDLVDRLVAPHLGDIAPLEAMIATNKGNLRIRLFSADAPLTVENFLRLADAGYFDGQEWPRVVPNFVLQGGDPRGDTSGGPGYAIRDEINRHRYAGGTVGMALAGPETGGSQFFITHSPQPHLDGTYAVFGELVDGQEVARRLLPGDTIESIRSTP